MITAAQAKEMMLARTKELADKEIGIVMDAINQFMHTRRPPAKNIRGNYTMTVGGVFTNETIKTLTGLGYQVKEESDPRDGSYLVIEF